VNQELLCSRDRHGRSERPKDEVAVGVEKALLGAAPAWQSSTWRIRLAPVHGQRAEGGRTEGKEQPLTA
jgi:hypothetical protein